MEDIVLEVKNVSKIYRLRDRQGDNLKDIIANVFSGKKRQEHDFYALKNVSFNLHEGEVVGIIGKNGAGKSTLLRMLSGITQPDEGEINFYGKSVSVLDVGAGFHPELSGRENVYLSASIYGLSNEETDKRFDEIVEFSGIKDFIDEPVKNYSAGMYLRLAFSVVTTLDADILIFDEVLYFGDDEFKLKSRQNLESLCKRKKSIILVSHDQNTLLKLCNRIIVMSDGQITGDYDMHTDREELMEYMSERLDSIQQLSGRQKNKVDRFAEFNGIQEFEGIAFNRILINKSEAEHVVAFSNNDLVIEVEFELKNDDVRYDFSWLVTDVNGVEIFSTSTMDPHKLDSTGVKGNNVARYIIPRNYFYTGEIQLSFIVVRNMTEIVARYRNIRKVSLERIGDSFNNMLGHTSVGLMMADFRWTVEH